ncbi:MAG TPA: hypothetical protein VF058_00040 [Actinomycetota bacterium]
MATIATQPQVEYRPGPRWMALFLVAAAGIGAGTVALVQTMTSEGVTAGRTAAVSSVDGATQTRALNQPAAVAETSSSASFKLSAVLDLRSLNESEAPLSSFLQGILDGRTLNEVRATAGSLATQAYRDRLTGLAEEIAAATKNLDGIADARTR